MSDVYFNLHQRLFSVREHGRVVDRAECLHIESPRFVVQPAGRQRVLQEQRKNVHAFVRGEVIGNCGPPHGLETSYVSYNPYKAEHFCLDGDVGQPIFEADHAWLVLDTRAKPIIHVPKNVQKTC